MENRIDSTREYYGAGGQAQTTYTNPDYDESKQINKYIFETIYHGALERSNEISKERIDDIKFLQFEYGYENWSFIEDDENNKFKVGDKVSIIESKPISKNKRFQVMEILK